MIPMPQSVWTPEQIAAVFAGIERLMLALVAVAGGLVAIWLQLRSNKKEGQKSGAERDEKLNTVVAQGNGQQAANLARIATLEALLAKESGRADNRVRAIGAEAEVEIHREATAVAKDILKEPLAVLKEPLVKVKTGTGPEGSE